MQLTLDGTQRINLFSMLDAVEAQGRREAWAICALQSKLELNDEEKQAIEFRKVKGADGREFMLWKNNGHIEPREYELSDDDVGRVCRAVDNYRVVMGRDRAWWEPLVAQLPEPEEANGHKP
jgi:hypothetical protein